MPPLGVGDEQFGPGRGEEDLAGITVARGEIGQHRVARQMLERDCGVDQSAVEEDGAGQGASRVMILPGQCGDPARKGDAVDPRQGFAARRQLYDAAGRRTRLTWPDAYYVTYDYQVTGEMTTIRESGTTTLGTYAYDDLGRRKTLTRGNGVVTTYGFDPVSRLTSLASDLTGTTNDLTLGFGYNPASQITSTTRSNNAYSWTGAANVARNYTSNGLNQYSAATSTTFGFDARGNLTTSGSNTYSYSSENLLLTGPNSASLIYDPLMRLYQSGSASVAAAKGLYDGKRLIASYLASSGALTQRYILGAKADEQLLEINAAGVKTWIVADERGSVIAGTDSSGSAVSVNSYDEYGIPSASNTLRRQYTGQIYLSELGMYYYKARMYSPTLGRFMQADPIGYRDGINWYNYVGGDPINRIDTSGLSCTYENYAEVETTTWSDGSVTKKIV